MSAPMSDIYAIEPSIDTVHSQSNRSGRKQYLRTISRPASCKPGDEHGKERAGPHEGRYKWYPYIKPVSVAGRNHLVYGVVGLVG